MSKTLIRRHEHTMSRDIFKGVNMNGRSPEAMNIRCTAKLQFRGGQRCANLEFRATFSKEDFYV